MSCDKGTTTTEENDAFRSCTKEEDEATTNVNNGVAPDNNIGSLLTALSENFKSHLDLAMTAMQDHNKRDFESLLHVMQQESARRTALEHRFHSQLLLQNEYMVAMELKLLRLEAKVERRESAIRQQFYQQQQQQQLQQQQLQLQQSRSHHSFSLPTTIQESSMEIPANSHRTATSSLAVAEESPPNLAVISSGASLASGVTAGSFLNDDGDDPAADDDSGDDGSATLESDSGNPVVRREEEEENHRVDDDRLASQQSSKSDVGLLEFSVTSHEHLHHILPSLFPQPQPRVHVLVLRSHLVTIWERFC